MVAATVDALVGAGVSRHVLRFEDFGTSEGGGLA
jgi:hypothetical protein